jgi:DNA-binding transcriptional ArsR family regulator
MNAPSSRVFINQLVEYDVGGFMERTRESPTPHDQLSRVFAALADPTRRDLVARLAVSDATVGQLAAPYAMSIQAVSKHLKVLEDCGLVTQRREAQRRPRHLEAEVFELMTGWIDRYRKQAEERFRRLDAVLARLDDEHTTNNPQRGTAL